MSRGLAMGGHQSARMESDTWLTPPEIVSELGPFDLDPCAAPGQPWPTAAEHYTLPTNGLTEPWHGRVWLNPPYSREAVKWLRKLADHNCGIALVFARTETSWFVETVWERASAVLFLHGRLHFHHPDGTRAAANAGAPSCLVAYGMSDAQRLATTGLPGTLWIPRGGLAQQRRKEGAPADRPHRLTAANCRLAQDKGYPISTGDICHACKDGA